MRKIESKLREAINNFHPFHDGNTSFVQTSEDGWSLYLHGNKIATFDAGGEYPTIPTAISLAGWNTTTTRSRLNALDGIHIVNKNFTPYLNGVEIDADGWYPIFRK